MRSFRKHCMVVSLALLAGTAACKKEGGASGSGGAAGDDLNVVPADSDVVMNIDLAKLRASGVYKEFGEKLLSKATKEISEFKETCGFDPVETITSFSLGIKMLDDKGRGSVVIHSSAPKDKLKACLEKSKAKAEAKGTTIKIEGDIAYMSSKDNDGFVALTFLGSDGVVALINDTEWTKEKVEAALKGGGSVKANKPVMDAIGALKKSQTMWFWVNGNAKFAKQAEQMGMKAQAFFGSLNVTDGLSMDFRARMATADEAKATADALKGQMAQAQMFFTKIESRADGNDFRVDAELTGSQLKGVASMVGMNAGGGGGGGGGGDDHSGHGHDEPQPVAPEAPAAPAAPAPAQ
jgi:hypothetical protein